MLQVAFIFSGQGSQSVGMGKELADNFKIACETFQEADEVEEICRRAAQGEVVSPANFNRPWQIVISGHTRAVSRAVEYALERGAKKAVMLAVSAPFHWCLMKPAAEMLKEALQELPVYDINTPVISNADPQPYPSKEKINDLLVKQVHHPVGWEESMKQMVGKDRKTVIEIET